MSVRRGILCADVGNTAVKVAMLWRGHVVARASVPTGTPLDAAVEELARDVRVEATAMCSVVPDATRPVAAALARVAGRDALVVTYRAILPLRVTVREPERVGGDRLCAAAGAIGPRRHNVVVVDIGSAVTVDRVRDGAFVGGAILPGAGLMLDALHRGTGQLPRVRLADLPDTTPPVGDATVPALALGAALAVSGGIREAVSHLRAGKGVPVVLTGGGLPLVRSRLPRSWRSDPDLVFRGLERIALLNC